MVFVRNIAPVVDLCVDQVGVDAADGRAKIFGERDVKWRECTTGPATLERDGRRCTLVHRPVSSL